jgi:hypothetical protein
MYSKRTLMLLGVILIALGCSASVSGQIIFGQPNLGQTQFVYTHWKVERNGLSNTISQFLVPVSGLVPLQDNFEARFFIASQSNSLKRTTGDISVNGLTDASVQFNHSFKDDHWLLSGGFNLPTGKTQLNPLGEWPVVEYLSQNFLNFPVRQFGQGFGFNILAGGATMVGQFRCGLGVSYRFTGSYKPYKDAGDYNPGDVVSINGGADYRSGGFSLSPNVIVAVYGTDKINSKRVFKQSLQTSLSLNSSYETDKYALSGGIGLLLRGRNTEYDPAADTLLDQLRLYGNEFAANASLLWKVSQRWRLTPTLGLRHIGKNERVMGTSNLYNFGTNAGLKLGEHIDTECGFSYYTGNADAGSIDLTAYQLSLSIAATW